MPYRQIRYEVADGIATITLHRPDALNAFTDLMRGELIDAVDRTDADDEVRVVVLTGAGGAFCAGADLGGGAATFDYDAAEQPPEAVPLLCRKDNGSYGEYVRWEDGWRFAEDQDCPASVTVTHWTEVTPE